MHLLLSGTSKETTFHRYETSQAAEVSRSTWFAAIHVKRAENIAQKNLRPPTMLFCSRPQEFQEKSTSYHVAHWAKLLLTETFFKYLTSEAKSSCVLIIFTRFFMCIFFVFIVWLFVFTKWFLVFKVWPFILLVWLFVFVV